jgi:multiple sugar transport system permease protein
VTPAPSIARLRSPLLYALVAVGGVLFALSFRWIRTTPLTGQAGAGWLPCSLDLIGYLGPWRTLPFARFYPNTTLFTLLAIGGALLSSSFAAFAFSRMAFPVAASSSSSSWRR